MKKIYENKKILIIIGGIILLILLLILNLSNDNNKEEGIVLNERTINITQKEEQESFYVDIKGSVNKPGVYEFKTNDRVIDQTTTNMIQKLNLLFARNPLKSKEI